KWAYEVRSADELPIALQRGFKEALTPPTGPVFLSLPADVMLADATDVPEPKLSRPATGTRGDEGEIARAAARLIGAEHPRIVAGDGVGLADAWPELMAIAERLGAPVYTEALSTVWNFPQQHPHWVGSVPDVPSAIRALFDDVDVALVCGFTSQAPVAHF